MCITEDSTRYFNAKKPSTNLSAHIETYLSQNKYNDEKLPKQLEKLYEDALPEQKNNRSYYYHFNVDGLRLAIDSFYNAVLAESNTGSSTGPYTGTANGEDFDSTVESYLKSLIPGKSEDGYDASIKSPKTITELDLKWSDILRWEEMLRTDTRYSLTRVYDPGIYIEKKLEWLEKNVQNEYRKKIRVELKNNFLYFIQGAAAPVVGNAIAREPFNAVAVATGVAFGTIATAGITLLTSDRSDIKKVKKLHKAIEPCN
jgi:hypothetical protein